MFDLPTLTLFHVFISILGIVAGLVTVGGFLAGKRLDSWSALFLVTTILTSVTAFLFTNTQVTPGQIIGGISLVVLAICVVARYGIGLKGIWLPVYLVTAVVALYLNVFVLIVQTFVKNPVLAPYQGKPPFAATHAIALLLFIWLGWKSLRSVRSA